MKIRIVKNRITGILSVKRMLGFLALYFSPFLFSQMYVSEGATLYIGKDAQVVTKTNTEADKKDVAENTIYSKGGRILIADASQKYRIVLVPRRVLARNASNSDTPVTRIKSKTKTCKHTENTANIKLSWNLQDAQQKLIHAAQKAMSAVVAPVGFQKDQPADEEKFAYLQYFAPLCIFIPVYSRSRKPFNICFVSFSVRPPPMC